jgi:hypothetical protein
MQLASGLHPTPLFVTITDGKLMSQTACRRPALAQSPLKSTFMSIFLPYTSVANGSAHLWRPF